MATRPAGLDPKIPRRVLLDPDGPPNLLKLGSSHWDPKAPLPTKPREKAAEDKRAGGGPVSEARLDVEDDVEKVIEEAFTIARDRMKRRLEGGR